MLQDEIARRIIASAEAGKSFTQIVVGLAIDFGYTIPVAKRIVNMTLHPADGSVPALYPAAVDAPDIVTQERRAVLAMDGAQPSIAFEQYFPRIVLLDKFLSDVECAALCAQGMELLAPAEIIQQGNLSRQDTIRSSFTARFPEQYSDLVSQVERRITQLVDWPTENSESLQIQRYAPGQQYIPHFDFFENPDAKSDEFVTQGGQRLATLIIYLKAPEAGGATYFPTLGLRVAARVGSALFFSYPDASVSNGTMHCGEPVIAGEKWILTKWFRQGIVANKQP